MDKKTGKGRKSINYLRKYIIEEIKSYIEKLGYFLISTRYSGANDRIKLKCPKGHLWEVTFAGFKNGGRRCKKCATIKRYKGGAKASYGRNRSKRLSEVRNYRNSLALYDTHAHKIDFCEEVRRDPNNTNLLQVRCTEVSCGKWFNSTNSQVFDRTKSLNGKRLGESKFYCSDICKQTCSIYHQKDFPKEFKNKKNKDSKVQSDLRDLVLKKDNYTCQYCESKKDLKCHHIESINVNPTESADVNNCITVCKNCHDLIHSIRGCRPVDLTKNNICKEL